MTTVHDWLKGLGLDQYVDVFEENNIDMSLFPQADGKAIKDNGVKIAGHWLRLRNAIAFLDGAIAWKSGNPCVVVLSVNSIAN